MMIGLSDEIYQPYLSTPEQRNLAAWNILSIAMVGLLVLITALMALVYQRDRLAEAETIRQRARFAEMNQKILNNQQIIIRNMQITDEVLNARCHGAQR